LDVNSKLPKYIAEIVKNNQDTPVKKCIYFQIRIEHETEASGGIYSLMKFTSDFLRRNRDQRINYYYALTI